MATTAYFAPTYFPPAYFASLTQAAPVGPGPSTYFAPSYFPPSYFSPLVPSAPVEPTPSTYGDLDAYGAILGLLRGTKSFDAVLFSGPSDRHPAGSGPIAVATVVPEGWEEFDEVDPTVVLRRVNFSIELTVRDGDPLDRFGRLGQLESIARRALDGSDLGGGCLPGLTRLRRGRYDRRSLPPEQAARVDGEFTYLIQARDA